MAAQIDTLINAQDGWELARDTVAAILAVEIEGQKVLAASSGENLALWDLEILAERDRPIGDWVNLERCETYRPIVNVWVESVSFTEKQSHVTQNQADVVLRIDCYGLGWSKANNSGGHNTGDRMAALEAQRAFKLVRGILLSEHYTYLGSPRKENQWCFGRRITGTAKSYRPDEQLRAGFSAVVMSITLEVRVKEQVPLITGEVIENVLLEVNRDTDGKVYVKADYDFT